MLSLLFLDDGRWLSHTLVPKLIIFQLVIQLKQVLFRPLFLPLLPSRLLFHQSLSLPSFLRRHSILCIINAHLLRFVKKVQKVPLFLRLGWVLLLVSDSDLRAGQIPILDGGYRWQFIDIRNFFAVAHSLILVVVAVEDFTGL